MGRDKPQGGKRKGLLKSVKEAHLDARNSREDEKNEEPLNGERWNSGRSKSSAIGSGQKRTDFGENANAEKRAGNIGADVTLVVKHLFVRRCCLDPSARPPCRPRYLRRDSASTPAPVGTQPSPSEVAESRTTACQRLNPEGNPPDCRLDGEVQARQGVACPFSNGGATEGRALCCTRPAVHHRH
ncbi:hypothetical protein C7M84_008584 [Penaeus vannamei]|uniref:Uncharacterized protein n=1 Tax=Penaeus vannamei TaxID=6689 RepID=A0A3R7SSH0_PENVA|nr:hypothetical protein C7M84_008584 [Penaeus vannamei]